MDNSSSRLRSFFQEAKRRRVFRVVAVYAVVGFAVIEGADIVFPTLSIPPPLFTVVLVLTLLGFPVALVIGWVFDLSSWELVRTPPLRSKATEASGQTESTDRQAPVSEKSVAVLPFANMSDDDGNDYFSDGITEEIINALTKMPGLRVAARTSSFSFKGRNEDITEIGRSLRVATVLEGSVRSAGERVRITAQLVNVEDGYHIWSEVYDRELADIFAVQEDIAQAIVDKLKLELLEDGHGPLVQRHTESLEAYNFYLKGRYFWNQREEGLAKGIEYFEQAIAEDERYALAYAGLADSYNLLGFYGFMPPEVAFPRSKEHARTALRIDPDLGEAHVSLAFACMLYDWDWEAAEKEFLRGLESSPGYATGHHWYSELLMATGRAEEAIIEAERAIELDPIGLIINTLLGMAHYFARNFDRAVEACRQTLELLPDFLPVYLWLGLACVQKGEHEEAIEVFRKTVAGSNGRPAMKALLGYAYAVGGRRSEAEAVLRELETTSSDWYVSPFDLARVHIGLGHTVAALEQLEAAYEDRAMGLVWAGVDPTLDPLRDEPRFRELLQRLRLAPIGVAT